MYTFVTAGEAVGVPLRGDVPDFRDSGHHDLLFEPRRHRRHGFVRWRHPCYGCGVVYDHRHHTLLHQLSSRRIFTVLVAASATLQSFVCLLLSSIIASVLQHTNASKSSECAGRIIVSGAFKIIHG